MNGVIGKLQFSIYSLLREYFVYSCLLSQALFKHIFVVCSYSGWVFSFRNDQLTYGNRAHCPTA